MPFPSAVAVPSESKFANISITESASAVPLIVILLTIEVVPSDGVVITGDGGAVVSRLFVTDKSKSAKIFPTESEIEPLVLV